MAEGFSPVVDLRAAAPIIDHIEITVRDMRVYSEVTRIGATIVSAPREYPEYTPAGYYAFYFKDPEGIKYEIVSTGRSE